MNLKTKLIFAVLIFLMLFGLASVVWFIKTAFFSGQPLAVNSIDVNQPTNQSASLSGQIIPPTKTDCADELDTECWNTYRNTKLGITFKFPVLAVPYFHYYDGNYFECENVDSDYILVPYTTLSRGNNIFIREAYYYKKYNNQCVKIINSIDDSGISENNSWYITIQKIAENNLDHFIKEKYGSGCSYGGKRKVDDSVTYDVIVNGDGKDLSLTECPINYSIAIKSNPANEKIAYWSMGQECIIGLKFPKCFDSEIMDSFQFID
ncbi:MAG: hypothetical protein WC480_00505 [Patescibacteria group bacterium]